MIGRGRARTEPSRVHSARGPARHVKDREQLGAGAHQHQRAVVFPNPRPEADQCAQAAGVHELDLVQIQDQVVVSQVDERLKFRDEGWRGIPVDAAVDSDDCGLSTDRDRHHGEQASTRWQGAVHARDTHRAPSPRSRRSCAVDPGSRDVQVVAHADEAVADAGLDRAQR